MHFNKKNFDYFTQKFGRLKNLRRFVRSIRHKQKTNKMKVQTIKSKEYYYSAGKEITKTITTVLVDGVRICDLTPIKNAKKEGYDSRVKFLVHSFSNDLNLKFHFGGARSINQVVSFFN